MATFIAAVLIGAPAAMWLWERLDHHTASRRQARPTPRRNNTRTHVHPRPPSPTIYDQEKENTP